MTYTHPEPRSYKGSITDTDRWQQFHRKPNDIFVCTPPKSGTTWTIAIATMLMMGRTDVNSQKLAQWVDATVVLIQDVVDGLAGQTHRRCIKTHTNFDGIPWFSDASYIAVYRHPIDVMLSLRKHLLNAHDTNADHPMLGTEDNALNAYVSNPFDQDNFDADCLEGIVKHYQSYASPPRPDNLLLLHYADMLADTRGAIVQIAAHIGVGVDPALIDAVLEASSFGTMKSQAEHHAPFADQGYWRDPKAFFDSAGTRKWSGKVSKSAVSDYKEKLAQLLSPTDMAWLEGGETG